MHLVLRLNQSVAETVDATCIDDLYKLTVDNALDASSTLEGRITTAVSTVKKVNTLHTLDSNTPPNPC